MEANQSLLVALISKAKGGETPDDLQGEIDTLFSNLSISTHVVIDLPKPAERRFNMVQDVLYEVLDREQTLQQTYSGVRADYSTSSLFDKLAPILTVTASQMCHLTGRESLHCESHVVEGCRKYILLPRIKAFEASIMLTDLKANWVVSHTELAAAQRKLQDLQDLRNVLDESAGLNEPLSKELESVFNDCKILEKRKQQVLQTLRSELVNSSNRIGLYLSKESERARDPGRNDGGCGVSLIESDLFDVADSGSAPLPLIWSQGKDAVQLWNRLEEIFVVAKDTSGSELMKIKARLEIFRKACSEERNRRCTEWRTGSGKRVMTDTRDFIKVFHDLLVHEFEACRDGDLSEEQVRYEKVIKSLEENVDRDEMLHEEVFAPYYQLLDQKMEKIRQFQKLLDQSHQGYTTGHGAQSTSVPDRFPELVDFVERKFFTLLKGVQERYDVYSACLEATRKFSDPHLLDLTDVANWFQHCRQDMIRMSRASALEHIKDSDYI